MKKKSRRRRYVLKARQEQLDATRARIVDATMALHEEVGPRRTTISAIAERAGVERLTVYRHFPDEAAVFAACSHRFTELNPPPSPAAAGTELSPEQHIRRGLRELYDYYGRAARMLTQVYRDADDYPALAKIMAGFDAYLAQYAAALGAAGWRPAAARQRAMPLLRHLTRFTTWQSLESDGVNNARKIDLALAWLGAVEPL